jgi:hypothetical protein
MSYDSVVGFWQRVAEDEALQSRIHPDSGEVPKLDKDVDEASLSKLAKIATDSGFDCTASELANAERVLRFWNAVAGDENLQSQLRPLQETESAEESAAGICSVAAEVGYVFDETALCEVTDLAQAAGWMGNDELSDEQLDQIAGGASFSPFQLSMSMALMGSGFDRFKTQFLKGPGAVAQYM